MHALSLTRRSFLAGLATSAAEGANVTGVTAILPAGGRWQVANRTVSLDTNGSWDVAVGEAVRERWQVTSNAEGFEWRIRRQFLRDARMEADRFPALIFPTHTGKGFSEIPGFLDPEMILSGTEAFALGDWEKQAWYEALSAAREQQVQLAPSGRVYDVRFTTGLFSYAKTCADGTAPAVSLGAESVDRRRGPVAYSAGSVQEQVWTWRRAAAAPPFRLEMPDRFLRDQVHSLAHVHNQWMGWLFGNNPASVPILHEMGWYPMIQSVYASDRRLRQALERQLLFFAESGVEPTGQPFPRWWMKGYYKVVWGNLMDQAPHFIMAMHYHALNTGNRDFVRQVMPALERVARFLLSLDRDGDGVAEVPGTSGLPDGQHDCSNWFDIVKFGHKDAYVNAYAVAALEALAELKEWMGEPARAYREAHSRFAAGFNRAFWDEHAVYYMDWIDTAGRGRRYFYTDPNLLAIIFGIADRTRARRILANLDARYAALASQFRLSREAIWATPANMYPVSDPGDLVDFGKLGNQRVFPNYENGCSFFHTTGLEIAARGVAGQPGRAYEVFARVMREGYARNRFWAAALKWDTGELISEPLNNALLILWGFHHGCLGLRRSLAGLRATGSPAPQLEGAKHEFSFLGRDTAVQVRQGETTIRK